MRLRVVFSLLTVFSLGGCTSSSRLDDFVPRPSAEVTSSIALAKVEAAPNQSVSAEASETVYVGAEPAVSVAALLPAPRPDIAGRAIVERAIHPQRFRDAEPINFGKTAPEDYVVHGVDVSRWQGDINWPKLKSQGANFAFIKATDGGDHLDPMFKENWRKADAAGIPRGAYHFFYWCRTAASQADWFIRNVPRVEGALPPVIDVEWNHLSSCKKRPPREVVLEKMRVFMDRLEAHYGQRPIIYTAPDFYEDNLRGAFPNHPFWLRSVAKHPSKVYPNREWVFWQYSGSGLSHGVDGRIDLNVFRGSGRDWNKWLVRNTYHVRTQ